MPDPSHLVGSGTDAVSALTQNEAVRLFLDRALTVAHRTVTIAGGTVTRGGLAPATATHDRPVSAVHVV